MASAFGSEYQAYQEWFIQSQMVSDNEFFAETEPSEFAQRLQNVDYNKDTGESCILDFSDFLNRHNFKGIILGKMGDVMISAGTGTMPG